VFVFHIFHYFSAPTAKKNQPSTTIDTMTDNRPTQVEQDLLAINRQKTYKKGKLYYLDIISSFSSMDTNKYS
jgi:predicted nucleic-acid-binding protein